MIVDIPFGNDRLSFFSALGLSPKPLDLEVWHPNLYIWSFSSKPLDLEIWAPKPLNLEASPQTYGSRDLAPKALDLEDTPQPIDLEAWVPNLEI